MIDFDYLSLIFKDKIEAEQRLEKLERTGRDPVPAEDEKLIALERSLKKEHETLTIIMLNKHICQYLKIRK